MKASYDLLCIDERDSPNIKELSGKSKKELRLISNRRFFGLCGVIIPGAEYPDVNITGRNIQQKILGKGKYQPFHYVEILNKSKNWSWIGAKENVNKCDSLRALLNNFCLKSNYKILASFLDKTNFALLYGVFKQGRLSSLARVKPNLSSPSTPVKVNLYMISLKFILQEYFKYLKDRRRRGLIIAEARGEVEDRLLLEAFYSFQKSGAGSLSGKDIRSYITDLLIVRKSQNHIGCQLADLITYPVYDYFVPGHGVRKDHFIKRVSLDKKIYKIKIFP